MIRRYELMVILDPNQADEALQEQIGKIENLMKSSPGGEILSVDNWGKKRLAYEIQGRPFGVYVVWQFTMDGAGMTELERHCRLDANNLRHLLLQIPEKVLKLKEREQALKASLEERRRRLAEASEDSPVVNMLSSIGEDEKFAGAEHHEPEVDVAEAETEAAVKGGSEA